ncbi:MAG TPA: hypothetical protein VE978_04060 [Chitinophagales bacterium]|nr:hypothetical protein [Chitinophagales bacterium]
MSSIPPYESTFDRVVGSKLSSIEKDELLAILKIWGNTAKNIVDNLRQDCCVDENAMFEILQVVLQYKHISRDPDNATELENLTEAFCNKCNELINKYFQKNIPYSSRINCTSIKILGRVVTKRNFLLTIYSYVPRKDKSILRNLYRGVVDPKHQNVGIGCKKNNPRIVWVTWNTSPTNDDPFAFASSQAKLLIINSALGLSVFGDKRICLLLRYDKPLPDILYYPTIIDAQKHDRFRPIFPYDCIGGKLPPFGETRPRARDELLKSLKLEEFSYLPINNPPRPEATHRGDLAMLKHLSTIPPEPIKL